MTSKRLEERSHHSSVEVACDERARGSNTAVRRHSAMKDRKRFSMGRVKINARNGWPKIAKCRSRLRLGAFEFPTCRPSLASPLPVKRFGPGSKRPVRSDFLRVLKFATSAESSLCSTIQKQRATLGSNSRAAAVRSHTSARNRSLRESRERLALHQSGNVRAHVDRLHLAGL